MTRGWNAFVYRTDLKEEAFCGFFYDDNQAKVWIKAQKKGTYDLTNESPRKRKESKKKVSV